VKEPLRAIGGVALGPLGFGGAPLGNLYAAIAEDEALAAVGRAWDAGIRHFDTAPHYGHGLSEHRLGEILRRRRRDDFVLSTKVGRLLTPAPQAPAR
jgi:D-threo-aldose 1-dehydrogenase